MSLRKVYKMLFDIGKTQSTNIKIELLEKYLENKLFRKVAFFALDENMHYSIDEVPKFIKSTKTKNEKKAVKKLFRWLEYLSNKRGATNQEKKKLFKLASIDEQTYDVMTRIVKKDLRCGCRGKLINKARPGTIVLYPYMRQSTIKKIDNIQWPAIIQRKADAMFAHMFVNEKGEIEFITRNGKKVHQLDKLKKIIQKGETSKANKSKCKTFGILNDKERDHHIITDCVIDGELVVMKDGKELPRKTSNGILNQCIQGTASIFDADQVVFKVWDHLPIKDYWNGKCDITYQSRLYNARLFCKSVNNEHYFSIIDTKYVDNEEEAQQFFVDMREKGFEGACLKNIKSTYKFTTSTEQIKMKNRIDVELEIIGWKYGKKGKKWENLCGSIICATECGKLEVSVTGMKDYQREWDWDLLIGEIAQLECESVITSKSKEKPSLYLPSFIEIRTDKSEADTLEDILNR